MKTVFKAALFILTFIACTREVKVDIVESRHSNGNIKELLTVKVSGNDTVPVHFKELYPNGNVKIEGPLSPERKRTGLWKSYYENGNKWSVAKYKNDKRNGLTTVYYENGHKRYEGRFIDGKKAGEWRFWNESGLLLRRETY